MKPPLPQEIDVKKIELKTYLAFHQDGIWDLTIGLALLGMALDLFWGPQGTSTILIIVALILVPGLKKVFTLPRLGYVKFSPERESKDKQNKVRLTVLFTITTVLGLVAFYAYTGDAGWQRWIRGLGLLPLGFVVALTALVLGLLYQVKRCIVYAVLAIAAFTATHVMQLHPGLHFLVLGATLTTAGAVLLVRFMTKYPRLPRENTGNV